MNRRTLLATLAALPLCGWMRPKAKTFTERLDERMPMTQRMADDLPYRRRVIEKLCAEVAAEMQHSIMIANEAREMATWQS